MRCFHCDFGVDGWTLECDPLIVHATNSPSCTFLRRLVGDEYVNNAARANEIKSRYCHVLSSYAARRNVQPSFVDRVITENVPVITGKQEFMTYLKIYEREQQHKKQHRLELIRESHQSIAKIYFKASITSTIPPSIQPYSTVWIACTITNMVEKMGMNRKLTRLVMCQKLEKLGCTNLMNKDFKEEFLREYREAVRNASETRERETTANSSQIFTSTRAGECIMCGEANVSISFTPCGHVFCCKLCSYGVTECSICRVPIKMRIPLFFT